jgi:hypothetical protein
MDYDKDKVDDAILALLWLTSFDEGYGSRTWKGHDWDHMVRLHEKGFISNPKGKAKSVAFSEEGRKRSEDLFHKFFGQATEDSE